MLRHLILASVLVSANACADKKSDHSPTVAPPLQAPLPDPKRADPKPRSTPPAAGDFTQDPHAVIHDPFTDPLAPAAYVKGDATQPGDVVLVVFDGFTTCLPPDGPAQSGLNPLTERLRDALETVTGEAPAVFKGCFGIDNDSVRISTSDDEDQEQITIVRLSDLAAKLSSFLSTRANPMIYFVGHSYGGWTAMHLASSFTGTGLVRGVSLLDAISVQNCKPKDFLAAQLDPASGAQGCRQAPSDFAAEQLARLGEVAIPELRNFYQDVAPLYSGPLSGWTNELVFTGEAGVDSHTALETWPAAWDAIEAGVTTDSGTLAP